MLVGFGHPDSALVAQQLKNSRSSHQFLESAGSDLGEINETGSVALVWCPRSESEAAETLSKCLELGFPTVALLGSGAVPPVDLTGGHVEFSFSRTDCDETLRRIEIVLARAHGPADRNVIRQGELVIDQDRYEVSLGGAKIDLTYKEYELLKYLATRPGRVFSREALLRAVWDYDYFGGTRTVDVHVRRLRSKINDVRYQFIETVWNVGYRFRSPSESSPE